MSLCAAAPSGSRGTTRRGSGLGLAAFAALATSALVGGCASAPSRGSMAAVSLVHRLHPSDLESSRYGKVSRDLAAAGVDAVAAATEGRLLRVACSPTTDGMWSSLALLPTGLEPEPRRPLLLRVDDRGTADREAVNPVVGIAPGQDRSGTLAHRWIPDWKARGRLTNYERVPLPGDDDDRHLIVQGSYLIACSAGRR